MNPLRRGARAHPRTGPDGPRAVPARSGLNGRSAREFAWLSLFSHPLRTGTVRVLSAERAYALGAILGVSLFVFSNHAAEELSNPLPPAEEQASFRLADPRLTVELVASEPDVL